MSATTQRHAQTVLQLYNQLQACGYSAVGTTLLRNAYDFAMGLFAGRYQPSGKTFIAHVVGTAGILASSAAPPEIVAAGLLHNVYVNGDFGDGTSGFTKRKQRALRRVIGEDVERYVAAFVETRWSSQDIAAICDGSVELGAFEREVVRIKLADELEHLSDLDVLYYNPAIAEHFIEKAGGCVAAARKLGFTTLAAELTSALELLASSDRPPALCCHPERNFAFVIVPRSHRKIFFESYCRRKIQKLRRFTRGVMGRLDALSRSH
jgi:(p)ppGpp synthase/HD superfamily hydrolase